VKTGRENTHGEGLFFSSGALESLRAWRVDKGGKAICIASYSGVQASEEDAGFSSRYVTVDGLRILGSATEEYLVAVGSTDASIRIFSFDVAKRSFRLIRSIWHHNGPVLALKILAGADRQHGDPIWLFAGATDGVVSLWDLSALTMEENAGTSCDEKAYLWPVPSLAVRSNQSGVNALDVAWSNEASGIATLATGGDDQALAAITIALPTPRDRQPPFVVSEASELCAHAAALRGVALCGDGYVLTTSADQRVVLWKLGGEVMDAPTSLSWVAAVLTEVSDVQAFHVSPASDGAGGVLHCVVVGLGLSWLEIHLPGC